MKVELDLTLTELRKQQAIAGRGSVSYGGMKLYDALSDAIRKAEAVHSLPLSRDMTAIRANGDHVPVKVKFEADGVVTWEEQPF